MRDQTVSLGGFDVRVGDPDIYGKHVEIVTDKQQERTELMMAPVTGDVLEAESPIDEWAVAQLPRVTGNIQCSKCWRLLVLKAQPPNEMVVCPGCGSGYIVDVSVLVRPLEKGS